MTDTPTDPTDETDDSDDERIGRPVQATPRFFLDTVDEHVDRGDVEGGVCVLRMADGGRRRFVLSGDVDDLAERDYAIGELEDLIDLIETEGLLAVPVETSLEVGDEERVVDEVRSAGTVTVQFGDEALSGLLAQFLAALARGS